MNPNDEYHADTARVSHSTLEVYRRSPAEYHGRFVTGTIPRPPSTPDQVFGSLVHCLLLEPEELAERYEIAALDHRRGNQWKEAKAESDKAGKELLLPSQYRAAALTADAVTAHPEAAKLLGAGGVVEQPIYWHDETGLACKCKPDLLIRLPEHVICVDLKTAVDPSPGGFSGLIDGETRRAGAIWQWGYHRQAAWYLDGIAAELGAKTIPAEWIFIVVGKAPPHDVYVYRLDAAYIEIGRGQNTHDICNLARSIETDDWSAPGQNELLTIEPPKWAREQA